MTLWCGLLIFYIDDADASMHIFITLAVFCMNLSLMIWMGWKLIAEVVFEYKHRQKAKDKDDRREASGWIHCLTTCSKKVGDTCPCLKDSEPIKRFRQFQSRVSRVSGFGEWSGRTSRSNPESLKHENETENDNVGVKNVLNPFEVEMTIRAKPSKPGHVKNNSTVYYPNQMLEQNVVSNDETLPEDWKEHYDDDTQSTYYENQSTGLTQWSKPMVDDPRTDMSFVNPTL